MITMVMPCVASVRSTATTSAASLESEAGERLVEKQDARLAGQRASKLHQAELLGGQSAGDAIGNIGKPDARR